MHDEICLFRGKRFDLFLVDEEIYLIRDKDGRGVYSSLEWQSNRQQLKESIDKLAHAGEMRGDAIAIADTVAKAFDILVSEREVLDTGFAKASSLSKTTLGKVGKKSMMSTSQINSIAKQYSDNAMETPSDLLRKLKSSLNEFLDSFQTDSIIQRFRRNLFGGLVYVTNPVSGSLPLVDRSPRLKMLCQQILTAYTGKDAPENITYSDIALGSYAKIVSCSDGSYYLERKHGNKWTRTRKFNDFITAQDALHSIENGESDKLNRKEEKKREREDKRKEKIEVRKAEREEAKKNKKENKNTWKEYS